jgi:hypothetical protein
MLRGPFVKTHDSSGQVVQTACELTNYCSWFEHVWTAASLCAVNIGDCCHERVRSNIQQVQMKDQSSVTCCVDGAHVRWYLPDSLISIVGHAACSFYSFLFFFFFFSLPSFRSVCSLLSKS